MNVPVKTKRQQRREQRQRDKDRRQDARRWAAWEKARSKSRSTPPVTPERIHASLAHMAARRHHNVTMSAVVAAMSFADVEERVAGLGVR